jgi:hypothetical protein
MDKDIERARHLRARIRLVATVVVAAFGIALFVLLKH